MESAAPVWLYPTIITVLIGVIGFFGRIFTKSLLDKLDRLISQIEELNINVVKQNERQNAFEDRLDLMDQRYNFLNADLKDLAKEHRQCKNFDCRPTT